jgi:hypothetical protein
VPSYAKLTKYDSELFKTPASFDPNVPHGHRRFDMKHRGRMHTWTCESKGRKVPKCYTVQDAKNFLDNRTKNPYHPGTWNCHHAQEALLRDMGVEVPPPPVITRFTAKIATYLPDSLARDQPLPDDLFRTSASLDQNLIRRLFMDETTYFPLDRAMISPQYFGKCPKNLDEIAAGAALSYPPVFGPHRSIPSTAKTTSPLLPTASISNTHIPDPSPPNAETKRPNPFTESYSNSYTTSSSFTKPGRSSKTQLSLQEDGKGGVLATAMLGIGAVGLSGSTAGATLVNGLVITGVKVGIAASASGSPMVTVGVVLSATNPVGLAWMGGIFAVSAGTMVAGAILSGRKRERRGK